MIEQDVTERRRRTKTFFRSSYCFLYCLLSAIINVLAAENVTPGKYRCVERKGGTGLDWRKNASNAGAAAPTVSEHHHSAIRMSWKCLGASIADTLANRLIPPFARLNPAVMTSN